VHDRVVAAVILRVLCAAIVRRGDNQMKVINIAEKNQVDEEKNYNNITFFNQRSK
jgi:hypothetical protein